MLIDWRAHPYALPAPDRLERFGHTRRSDRTIGTHESLECRGSFRGHTGNLFRPFRFGIDLRFAHPGPPRRRPIDLGGFEFPISKALGFSVQVDVGSLLRGPSSQLLGYSEILRAPLAGRGASCASPLLGFSLSMSMSMSMSSVIGRDVT